MRRDLSIFSAGSNAVAAKHAVMPQYVAIPVVIANLISVKLLAAAKRTSAAVPVPAILFRVGVIPGVIPDVIPDANCATCSTADRTAVVQKTTSRCSRVSAR